MSVYVGALILKQGPVQVCECMYERVFVWRSEGTWRWGGGREVGEEGNLKYCSNKLVHTYAHKKHTQVFRRRSRRRSRSLRLRRRLGEGIRAFFRRGHFLFNETSASVTWSFF